MFQEYLSQHTQTHTNMCACIHSLYNSTITLLTIRNVVTSFLTNFNLMQTAMFKLLCLKKWGLRNKFLSANSRLNLKIRKLGLETVSGQHALCVLSVRIWAWISSSHGKASTGGGVRGHMDPRDLGAIRARQNCKLQAQRAALSQKLRWGLMNIQHQLWPPQSGACIHTHIPQRKEGGRVWIRWQSFCNGLQTILYA